MKRARVALLALLSGLAWAARGRLEVARDYVAIRYMNRSRTVAERVSQYGTAVRDRLAPSFERAGVPYPPSSVTLAVFKDEKVLRLYAAGPGGALAHVRDYPVLAASGSLGPKLREGDLQVPEGVYPVESLNPNSLFHLALRVGYPNAFDRARAREDGRKDLGGDIMIHGNAVSVGCVAVGDDGAEDLFVLSALVGVGRVRLLFSPVDFRRRPAPRVAPVWTAELYRMLSSEVAKLPKDG